MIKKAFFTIVICLFSGLLMAQETLSIKSVLKQRGDTVEVKLKFSVLPGMHVYAPSTFNESQGYTVMKLWMDSIPAGLRFLKNVSWPESDIDAGSEVYRNEGHVIVFKLQGKPKQWPARIKGTLLYQACNETMCFPPDEKEFIVELKSNK